MSAAPGVLGVGTATPRHTLSQGDAKGFARQMFEADFPAIHRLLPIFDNTGIESRNLACEKDWYLSPRSFSEKNDVYLTEGLALSVEASRRALASSGVDPSELAALVFVTSTGISTPGLDATLVQRLDLPRDIARVPMWGLGCAGGAAGLARASTLSRALGRPVLLVAVELCSVTFVSSDRRKANLVATALFGDGAAAVVVGPGARLQIQRGFSHLVDDSAQVMGWDLVQEGLQVRFSPGIPALVRRLAPRLVEEASRGVAGGDFEHWVLHPGGAKVLDAYRSSLALSDQQLAVSQHTLQKHGNMSSPTVLFALERFMDTVPATGGHGLALSLGPGFSAEGVVFVW